jgi:hypothetical protein
MPILTGGRKRVQVSQISKGRIIGIGSEAVIRKVIVNIKGKKVALAEKTFNPRKNLSEFSKATQPNLRNPQRQFKIIQAIRKLNNKHHLRLPLLPTMRKRIIKNEQPRIISTWLKHPLHAVDFTGRISLYKVTRGWVKEDPKSTKRRLRTSHVLVPTTRAEEKEFELIKRRTSVLLEHFGYKLDGPDAWVYSQDPKTKKITMWLADFGNIIKDPGPKRKLSPEEKRELNSYLQGKPYTRMAQQ